MTRSVCTKALGLVLLLSAGCCGDHERDFFDWLFATSPAQTNARHLFQQHNFHKEPHHVSRGFQRSYYKAHFPIDQLWPHFTQPTAAPTPTNSLAKNNRNSISLRFDGRRNTKSTILEDIFSGNFHHVIETLPNKFSLVLQYERLSEQFTPINWLREQLLEQHKGVHSVHGYYSAPGGARALHAHTDPYDVIILQINGSKRWTICLPRATSSQTSSAERANKFARDHSNGRSCVTYTREYLASQDHACLNFSMQVGDVLYLPRNVIHFAETIDESTFHLTIGLEGEENATPNSFKNDRDCDKGNNKVNSSGNGNDNNYNDNDNGHDHDNDNGDNEFFTDVVKRTRRACSSLSGGYSCQASCDACDSSCQGVGTARACDASCDDCDDECDEGCHVNYHVLTTAACVTRITSQADCSYAAQVLTYSDTSATSVFVSNRPRGCYTSLGSLYFNLFSSTVSCDNNHQCMCVGEAGGATVATTIAAQPFFELSAGSCGCAVESLVNCSEAATTLGYSFSTTNDTFSNTYPRACSFTAGARGELVYNYNTTSTTTCSVTNKCLCHRSGSDECVDGGSSGDTNSAGRRELSLEVIIAIALAGAMCCFIGCAVTCYKVCCGDGQGSRVAPRIVPFVQNPAIEATLTPHEIMQARRVHSQSIITSPTLSHEESHAHDEQGVYDNVTTTTAATTVTNNNNTTITNNNNTTITNNTTTSNTNTTTTATAYDNVGNMHVGEVATSQGVGHDYAATIDDEPYYATIESDPVYIEPLSVPGVDRRTSPEYEAVEGASISSRTEPPTHTTTTNGRNGRNGGFLASEEYDPQQEQLRLQRRQQQQQRQHPQHHHHDQPPPHHFSQQQHHHQHQDMGITTSMLIPQEGATVNEQDLAASTTTHIPTNETDAYTLEPVLQ